MIAAIRRSLGQAIAVSIALLLALLALFGGYLVGMILPGRR